MLNIYYIYHLRFFTKFPAAKNDLQIILIRMDYEIAQNIHNYLYYR